MSRGDTVVSYVICAEKAGSPLILLNGWRKAYTFPKYTIRGKFKYKTDADSYLEKYRKRLNRCLIKNGYEGYDLCVIQINAPHVTE